MPGPILMIHSLEIDREIFSTVIPLPSADSFTKGCCQVQGKYVHEVLVNMMVNHVNRLFKLAQGKKCG